MVIFLGIIFCCDKITNDVTVKKVGCIIKICRKRYYCDNGIVIRNDMKNVNYLLISSYINYTVLVG